MMDGTEWDGLEFGIGMEKAMMAGMAGQGRYCIGFTIHGGQTSCFLASKDPIEGLSALNHEGEDLVDPRNEATTIDNMVKQARQRTPAPRVPSLLSSDM